MLFLRDSAGAHKSSVGVAIGGHPGTLGGLSQGKLGSWIEPEDDLVRVLVAAMSKLAPPSPTIRKPHFVSTRIDAALSLAA